MQRLQYVNAVIQKSEENLAPILPNIDPFHYLLNESVHNSRIFNFERFCCNPHMLLRLSSIVVKATPQAMGVSMC